MVDAPTIGDELTWSELCGCYGYGEVTSGFCSTHDPDTVDVKINIPAEDRW